MTNDLETTRRLLEAATAPGNDPAGGLDAEAVSLREAWLAFGELLEAAETTLQAEQSERLVDTLPRPVKEAPRGMSYFRRQPHWLHLAAAGLLAGVAVIWILYGPRQKDGPIPGSNPQVVAQPTPAPPQQVNRNKATASNVLKWDDSLDEQLEQVSWQMLCMRGNQTFRTDAISRMQYRIEELNQAIQSDSL